MFSVEEVVKKFCEKKNIKFELLPDNTSSFSNLFKCDNTFRMTFLTKKDFLTELLHFVPHSYNKYNNNHCVIPESSNISLILSICTNITGLYRPEICNLCNGVCRNDNFKCHNCQFIICGYCSHKIRDEIISKIESDDTCLDDIEKHIKTLDFKLRCPSCDHKYDDFIN